MNNGLGNRNDDLVPSIRVDCILLIVLAHIIVCRLREKLIDALAFAQQLTGIFLMRKAANHPGRVECGQESARYTGSSRPERLFNKTN